MTYNIVRSQGNYIVEQANKKLFELHYPSIWCNSAKGKSKENTYSMAAENMWGNRYGIWRNGQRIGSYKTRWTGNFEMYLTDEDGHFFLLEFKYKGFMRPRFEVYLNQDKLLFTMDGRYNWFHVEWEVEQHHYPNLNIPIEEIIGMMGFGVRCHQMSSGYY